MTFANHCTQFSYILHTAITFWDFGLYLLFLVDYKSVPNATVRQTDGGG